MLKFNFRYFLCTIMLFITEALIALYMHDDFIRPTFGDFLVVILMYCGIRSIVQADYRYVAIATLLTAYIIEVSQYFHLIVHLGLQYSRAAQWLLGSGFAWGDMVAYTLGTACIWLVEHKRNRKYSERIPQLY
jgi:hypothetical protein